MRLFDAHNHLQDDRFGGRQEAILEACVSAGIARMVVNGSCEEDWPAVAELAQRWPDHVVPAFGLHPWYVHQRSSGWRDALQRWLDRVPGAVVGEIGIDRWILDCPAPARAAVAAGLGDVRAAALPEQEEVFIAQLALARERGVSATVHCLQAWGRLDHILRSVERPERGFLLHSYGGPAEMVAPLVRLGACFSFPGYFLHARKARQRVVFREIPGDRLLAETDAPDQRLPATPEWIEAGLEQAAFAARWNLRRERCPGSGEINHPANLTLVYEGLAQIRGESLFELAAQLEATFARLFGGSVQGGVGGAVGPGGGV